MVDEMNADDAIRRVQEHHGADRVLDAGALKALAHPLRVKIYDILSQYGAQTASSLAQRLGESSGATSYHLRALAKQDLIREVPGQGTARERWWERPAGGVTFGHPGEVATPSARAAHQLVTEEFFRLRQQQLVQFVTRGVDQEDEQWKDSSMVSTASTRLTPAQAKELAAKIMALVDEAVETHRDQTGDDVRPVTIRADLFPLPQLGDPS